MLRVWGKGFERRRINHTIFSLFTMLLQPSFFWFILSLNNFSLEHDIQFRATNTMPFISKCPWLVNYNHKPRVRPLRNRFWLTFIKTRNPWCQKFIIHVFVPGSYHLTNFPEKSLYSGGVFFVRDKLNQISSKWVMPITLLKFIPVGKSSSSLALF